ncbi:hypothetical protein ACFV19_16490 [Streptomyces griseoluteus]|uniref:hypothetical protein n=1 Tax=Streptomyces griseoluteus TaxID=29306 RepID=UPI0036CB034B
MFFVCWWYSSCTQADQGKQQLVRLAGGVWSGNGPDLGPSRLAQGVAAGRAFGVTVRDDMRQEIFRPLPIHLGALDETLKWGGEAAEAADTRIDVELTAQDGTLHVWLGLDQVDVRAVCDTSSRIREPATRAGPRSSLRFSVARA